MQRHREAAIAMAAATGKPSKIVMPVTASAIITVETIISKVLERVSRSA